MRAIDSLLSLLLLCGAAARFVPGETYFAQHDGSTEKFRTTPSFILLAPDLLRTDSEENLLLQAERQSAPLLVSILIQDFSKSVTLLQDSVTLDQDNGHRALKTIQLSSDDLGREERKKKFVNLRVDFGGLHVVERLLMLSFHSGFVFIQTDKPIYNPGDNVFFRAFVSSPSFKAMNSSISVDIKSPEGVVLKQLLRSRVSDGVLSDMYTLSDIVSEGTWTIIAKFDDWEQNTFTSTFQVKKYVLPAFNVTLTPKKSFISLDDTELEVAVSAQYLYGQPVQGTAYVVFGVKIGKDMRRLPSVQQVSDLEGGVARLSMDEIWRAHPNLQALVGNSVYVKASVLTQSGSDLVEAEKSGIKIVNSPYVITFTDAPQFFKPGLPYDFTLQVSHHDGSPAQNVPVLLNLVQAAPLLVSGATKATVNMPDRPVPHMISAVTAVDGLRPEQQARQTVRVQPYRAQDRRKANLLYVSMETGSVRVGSLLTVKMSVSTFKDSYRDHVHFINYLVVSKGKIVKSGRVGASGQSVSVVALLVTADMMPSFRFVAFYSLPWEHRDEVVSDSVWVDVLDSCVGGLRVGPVDDVHRDFAPGKRFGFKISGDPGSKVSLVVVDNSVFLLNKERLTQRKMWSVVEGGDMGCSRGGGPDAMSVFSDAGVLFSASSTRLRTRTREALQCGPSSRRRRSAEQLQRKVQLESQYKEKLQRRCCQDGLRAVPMPYSCTRRSLYITDGPECIRAFRFCCGTYRGQHIDPNMPTTPPPITTPPPTTSAPRRRLVELSRHNRLRGEVVPRTFSREMTERVMVMAAVPRTSGPPGMPGPPGAAGPRLEAVEAVGAEEEEEEEEGEYQDETQVYLRAKFFESWLWTDVDLPSQAEADGLASTTVEKALPDSITQWGVLAVSASPQTGFCVAEPYNVRAWKPFFVDLRLPHSVARNEQVEIKAVVHNYGEEELHVRVVLMKTEGVCSVAFRDRHTQEVKVAASSSRALTYSMVPLVVGKLPLELLVVARDMMGGDRIQKFLRVVMDGVQKSEVRTTILNPAAEGGSQVVRLGQIQLESVVPRSSPETFINVRGHVLADSIDNSLSEDSLASLIQMPGGCVEQNLARMTLPLIATLYLDRTNDWESVGVQRKAEAIRYIQRGYENQLVYRKSDGSYPPYSREGASTWITAFVVKVFSMAHSIIGIEEQQVCAPLLYLLKNKHLPTGRFIELNPVYSTTMTGGHHGDDPEVTLTAFVLIALAEARQAGIRCAAADVNMEVVMDRTSRYLAQAVKRLGRRPYTVAMVAYALALTGTDLTGALLRAAGPGGDHWPDSQGRQITWEATGYALLALLQRGDTERAAGPFKWLNSQRGRGGGFGSTQSTLVVLHALSQYQSQRPSGEDQTLDVDVRVAGRREIRYHFNPRTAYGLQSSRLPPDLDLEVEARGGGQGILEVVTYYNQIHDVDEKRACEHFDLSVALEESSQTPPADVEKSYEITIKVRALGGADVRMVVLDVSLPTGFTPDNSDLEMLSNSVDRYISNFQIVDNLSDRGSLIIHLFKVSHKEPEILIFRLQQNFKVGLLQPSAVTVYEYYTPDHRCSRTYSPREDREQLAQICRDDVCRCTQGDCCVSKADDEDVPTGERETIACATLHHVFKVKVLNHSQSYYDKYDMEITQVIKLGVEAGVEAGQRRLFMSHAGCRAGLDLQPGSQYLIMGPKEDRWNMDGDTNSYVYMLGKNTWVERWPLPAECSQGPGLQAKCLSLEEAERQLSITGCRL